LQKPPNDLKKILGPSENVTLYLPQKIQHPTISIDSVVLTNGRIILLHPHALGIKKDHTDFSYRDLSKVVLEKGATSSTIKITLRLGGELTLGDLPSLDAEKAYSIIKERVASFTDPMSPGYTGRQEVVVST